MAAFELVVSSLTLVMVFAIQHTQGREQAATQRKLDELIRAMPGANESLICSKRRHAKTCSRWSMSTETYGRRRPTAPPEGRPLRRYSRFHISSHHLLRTEQFMQKRLVTRYATESAEAADRTNAGSKACSQSSPRRVRTLSATWCSGWPTIPSCTSRFTIMVTTRLNPILSLGSFAHFQDGHEGRRSGGVDQQTATLVGTYITEIG